jgi:ANTAR domain/GAF domain
VAISAGLDHPVVTAALTAAATATGMEVVFVGGLTDVDFTYQRILGSWDGLAEGATFDRADSFCARLLGGGPTVTADARSEPAYASVSAVAELGVTSYVGVPMYDDEGRVLGTLCGIDHSPVSVGEEAVQILRDLAALIATHLRTVPQAGVVIRRTATGWQVEGTGESTVGSASEATDTEPELTTALTLADLLADCDSPPSRPRHPDTELDALGRLRIAVAQLEHALAARVVVEQAIGVLAERQRLAPRAAFERLRKAARSRGRRVHSLGREVVASAHSPGVPLPPELAGRRPG